MSYTVILKDGSKHSLDDANGFDLRAQWLDASKPFKLELGDDAIESTQIRRISRDRLTQADLPSTARQLPAGNKCRGRYSIQKKINEIAQRISGKESVINPNADVWQTLVSDLQWREMMRSIIWEDSKPDTKWCDHKKNICSC